MIKFRMSREICFRDIVLFDNYYWLTEHVNSSRRYNVNKQKNDKQKQSDKI